jgi:hypothetical protein
MVSLGLQRLMSTDVYRRNLFPYNKIKCLENENNKLKEHVNSSIAIVEGRYEIFRNVANNTTTFIADNNKLKADKLMEEVSQLSANIEELEHYGRQTSLRFHNVRMAQI